MFVYRVKIFKNDKYTNNFLVDCHKRQYLLAVNPFIVKRREFCLERCNWKQKTKKILIK